MVAGGCASYSSRMAATPLRPGAREIGLALDVLVVERGRKYIPLPLPEVSYRRGLRPGIDIGGQAHLTGVEASTRVALFDRGRVGLAAAAGLGFGFEPITNNTTDLIYARGMWRLLIELRPREPAGPWPTWIVAAVPSLTFTGPLTMFAGITESTRLIIRPGAAASARWPLRAGRAFWLEVTGQPAYAVGDGWLRAAFQGGAAITF